MKRKQIVILAALILGALLLSGCGVSRTGVDITEVPPDGLWQTLVVWPLGKALIWMDDALNGMGVRYHWGYAIILFTVIVKVITFPLTITQIRGMQAQKELQPKIQELQKKYGKDREKISQAQMKLYQEAGVNPLSGCLPLVVQMPILFGLYSALVALGPALTNAQFYWIPDLGFPEYSRGLSWISEAWNAGDYQTLAAYLVLPVLLMASQFIMQKWMTPATPPPANSGDGPAAGMAGMTKQLSLMMTFMFGFFTLQVPAGLTLYWVTSNLLQLLQQWAITSDRFGLTPATAAATTDGNTALIPDSSAALEDSTGNGLEPTPATTNGTEPTNKSTTRKKSKRRRAKRR